MATSSHLSVSWFWKQCKPAASCFPATRTSHHNRWHPQTSLPLLTSLLLGIFITTAGKWLIQTQGKSLAEGDRFSGQRCRVTYGRLWQNPHSQEGPILPCIDTAAHGHTPSGRRMLCHHETESTIQGSILSQWSWFWHEKDPCSEVFLTSKDFTNGLSEAVAHAIYSRVSDKHDSCGRWALSVWVQLYCNRTEMA